MTVTFDTFSHQRLAGADELKIAATVPPHPVFADAVIAMLSALSAELMRPDFRAFPDIAGLGFFCRQAHLSIMSRAYTGDTDFHMGRGTTVHYTPSNVPLNFCYSMIAGLLAGNSCIIRLSDKDSPESGRVIAVLDRVLSDPAFEDIRNRVYLLRCAPTQDNNDFLARLSDVRVLWGGDAAVSTIRQSFLKPHAFDVTFPDRYSICLVSSAAYLEEHDRKSIAAAFFNDTFLFDQNACSSPRAVIWVGAPQANAAAQSAFWDALHDIMLERGYRCPASLTFGKLMLVADLAVGGHEPEMHRCRKTGNMVISVNPDVLCEPSRFSGGGYFLQAEIGDLSQLPPLRGHKLQTVTYFGFAKEDLVSLIAVSPPRLQADRLVKIGKATAFDIVWDGYDLISQMSKRLVIQ